jgi:hypothetical protein
VSTLVPEPSLPLPRLVTHPRSSPTLTSPVDPFGPSSSSLPLAPSPTSILPLAMSETVSSTGSWLFRVYLPSSLGSPSASPTSDSGKHGRSKATRLRNSLSLLLVVSGVPSSVPPFLPSYLLPNSTSPSGPLVLPLPVLKPPRHSSSHTSPLLSLLASGSLDTHGRGHCPGVRPISIWTLEGSLG